MFTRILPFLFKRMFLIVELLTILALAIFVYFFYNYFVAVVSFQQKPEVSAVDLTPVTITSSKFEEIQKLNSLKKTKAGVYRGYIIHNPFEGTPSAQSTADLDE